MRHASLLGLGLLAAALPATSAAGPPAGSRVFELRTYHAHPGRFDALNARFRDHARHFFQKHGMEVVGFWTPREGQEGHGRTLIYLLAYPSRAAAEASWKAFRADTEWTSAKAANEKDGPVVEKIESVYLDPTDYSPVR